MDPETAAMAIMELAERTAGLDDGARELALEQLLADLEEEGGGEAAPEKSA